MALGTSIKAEGVLGFPGGFLFIPLDQMAGLEINLDRVSCKEKLGFYLIQFDLVVGTTARECRRYTHDH